MPGITYRSLDALVVSDEIFVVTRPVRSEINGLSLVISECYSKLEGVTIHAIMNQIEQEKDLAIQPNRKDIDLSNRNVKEIMEKLESEKPAISTIFSFSRVPFVTERIYVLEEENHRFSSDMKKFCSKILEE
jgi:MinD-like ATPase involved in chromosome partitioning or flagellar assembly